MRNLEVVPYGKSSRFHDPDLGRQYKLYGPFTEKNSIVPLSE